MKKAVVIKKARDGGKPVKTGTPVAKNEALRNQKKKAAAGKGVGNVNAETGTNPNKRPVSKPTPATKPPRTGNPVAANEALRKKKQAEAAKKKY